MSIDVSYPKELGLQGKDLFIKRPNMTKVIGHLSVG